MSLTQQHLSISDIKDDLLLLKSGGAALVLQTSAVNFGLLSEREQLGIIAAFAQMLNSLSFSIQILILSERLNISSYLLLLDKAQKMQTNPLLSQMMVLYRQFIQNIVKENEVLDKKFYIVIPVFAIELGLKNDLTSTLKKSKNLLLPRRDQLIRQLNRIGLKSTQLNTRQLIELFYDLYNGTSYIEAETRSLTDKPVVEPVNLSQPKPKLFPSPAAVASQPTPATGTTFAAAPINDQTPRPTRNSPFVVEELTDNI